ncbi:MAG: DUF2202 domain-containing protein [Leptolinea sp.]|nr:DUF2202 domain-containing protein [Leptolinea sp.]
MFKKFIQITILGTLALSLMAFSPAPVGQISTGILLPADTLQTTDLPDEVVDGLLLMREEEKLAHDVYVYLFEKWGMNVFENIAASEQAHTDAVKLLLDTYSIPDPAEGKDAGEFSDTKLQALYDQLIDQGSQSLGDALKVGAAIEEIDIVDLREALSQTSTPEIQRVYENLEKGSMNHLNSFTSTLFRQTGEEYQPKYLSQDAYQTIIGSGRVNGSNGQGNGQGDASGMGMGAGKGNGRGTGNNSGVDSETKMGTGIARGSRGGRR